MNPTLEPGAFLEPFSSDRLRWERDHPSIPLRYFAQNRVLSTFYVPFVPHTPAVTTGILHVAAGAPFIQESLGRRAATLLSLTKLIYIFFAVRSMRLLPASGLLSPPFAPARRAHPATRRPALSPLSAGAAHHRGGRRALKAGALKHLLAESLRLVPAALLGQKIGACGGRRAVVEAAAWRCWRFLVAFSKVVWGVLF